MFDVVSYSADAWRVVEAQHVVATLKLVDSLEEQQVLEAILEETKSKFPPECAGYYYLIATPFRYVAYPNGSRFRRPGRTPGVLYLSETDQTAIAEQVFYRLLTFAESPDTPLPKTAAEYTGFCIAVDTGTAIDLTVPPLATRHMEWTDPTRYDACQQLEEDARREGVTAIRYQSVRDPSKRANIAALTCAIVTTKTPTAYLTWKMYFHENEVTAIREFPRLQLSFPIQNFTDPRLAPLHART